jgi:hypothetical protein
MTARITRCAVLFSLTMLIALPAHAQPARTAPTQWRATEAWAVDGDGDVFGQVRDIAVLRDETVWVLDHKDQVIRRFSATGTTESRLATRCRPGRVA